MAYKDHYEGIDFEIRDGIAYLTFNNPKTLNAVSYATMTSWMEIFSLMKQDREIRGVILTGAGRSFIAGADLKDLPVFDYFQPEAKRDSNTFVHDAYNMIANFDRPTLAAINGFALGGGAELALCCDIRIASTKAKFGFPEVGLGAFPAYTGASRAVKLLGVSVAKEMIMTGKHYDAETCMRWNVYSHVTEPEDLMPTAEDLMRHIARQAPIAVKYGKLMCDRAAEMSYQASLEYENMLVSILTTSDDFKEGVSAFLEKRKPVFGNR